MPALFAAAFTTCQIAFGVIPSPQTVPSRLTRRKIAPPLIPPPWSNHRRHVSPTPGLERYGRAFLYRSGPRSPSVPRGLGEERENRSILFAPEAVGRATVNQFPNRTLSRSSTAPNPVAEGPF
jgi:hypothetical protein